mmetsp:Transcript_19025/g.72696  ORF Transcript_19025/g.72696 Transcript_19025/m.72696 type:complete len:236 (+) Transcript_19025:448-1155(+)
MGQGWVRPRASGVLPSALGWLGCAQWQPWRRVRQRGRRSSSAGRPGVELPRRPRERPCPQKAGPVRSSVGAPLRQQRVHHRARARGAGRPARRGADGSPASNGRRGASRSLAPGDMAPGFGMGAGAPAGGSARDASWRRPLPGGRVTRRVLGWNDDAGIGGRRSSSNSVGLVAGACQHRLQVPSSRRRRQHARPPGVCRQSLVPRGDAFGRRCTSDAADERMLEGVGHQQEARQR